MVTQGTRTPIKHLLHDYLLTKSEQHQRMKLEPITTQFTRLLVMHARTVYTRQTYDDDRMVLMFRFLFSFSSSIRKRSAYTIHVVVAIVVYSNREPTCAYTLSQKTHIFGIQLAFDARSRHPFGNSILMGHRLHATICQMTLKLRLQYSTMYMLRCGRADAYV